MSVEGGIRLESQDVFDLVPWTHAIEALRDALATGLDPSEQPARSAVPAAHGEILLMPAEFGGMAGVKVLSVAPGNPARGRPRIQGTYLLMDSQTLSPRAFLDAAALTTLRTPALAAVAVDALAAPTAHRLVVFGAGPQAEGHVHAMRTVRPIDDVSVVSRRPERAHALVSRLAAAGVAARTARAGDVAQADVIAAATTAATPLFDGALVRADAVVTAVGSHHRDERELDSALMARATVVVEDARTAMREAGDVVLAVADGALGEHRLVAIADVVRDPLHPARWQRRVGPAVFKSVGQGWQDLVIAHAADAAARARGGADRVSG